MRQDLISHPARAAQARDSVGLVQQDLPHFCVKSMGSSEAAAVMGLDPYRSQLDLWHRMVGEDYQGQAPDDEAGAGDSCWSSLLEPLVALVYSKRTGYEVRRVRITVSHPHHPWMKAAVRWQVLGTPDVQLLHCVEMEPDKVFNTTGELQPHLRIDAMHLLAVTGLAAVDVAVLSRGRDLRIVRMERDEALIERLIAAESKFTRLVEETTSPIDLLQC